MPIDINEDRRLRVTWIKYNNIIGDMKNYYYKKKYINDVMEDHNCSRYEAENAYEDEIKKIEQKRRNEMNKIRKEVAIEKKNKEEQERKEREEREKLYKQNLEKKRLKREQTKAEQTNDPVRRSKRVAKKNSNCLYTKLTMGYGSRWVNN